MRLLERYVNTRTYWLFWWRPDTYQANCNIFFHLCLAFLLALKRFNRDFKSKTIDLCFIFQKCFLLTLIPKHFCSMVNFLKTPRTAALIIEMMVIFLTAPTFFSLCLIQDQVLNFGWFNGQTINKSDHKDSRQYVEKNLENQSRCCHNSTKSQHRSYYSQYQKNQR